VWLEAHGCPYFPTAVFLQLLSSREVYGRLGVSADNDAARLRLPAPEAAQGARCRSRADCYWCRSAPATQLDHMLAVAEHGPFNAGPRVPSGGRCNGERRKQVQRRLAEKRRRGNLDGEGVSPPPPRWGKPGERQPKRKVYPGAICLE
jgi:hypothetical protein